MFAAKNELFTRPSGYTISRSVRLRSSASAYFNRTPASAGNSQKFTWSGWVKLGSLFTGTAEITLLQAGDGTQTNSTNDAIQLRGDGTAVQMSVLGKMGTGGTYAQFSPYLRDPSAWYHVVIAVDTTQATQANRCKAYLNGVQITNTVANGFTLNYSFSYLNNTYGHLIGRQNEGAGPVYTDGYLTEINFIDGQALTPFSFGETDAVTGVWKPKKYAGTYGTNGFYLNFSDNSNNTATTIGKDYSGNGNNWTPNNISVTAGVAYDSMLDVPTPYADGGNGRGNYCTLNPVFKNANSTYGVMATPISGNLESSMGVGTNLYGTQGLFGSKGKWYAECRPSSIVSQVSIGYLSDDGNLNRGAWINSLSGVFVDNVSKGTAGFATGNTIGIAYDSINNTVQFYVNGSAVGSAYSTSTTSFNEYLFWSYTNLGVYVEWNFGQRPFAYTPPSGFNALNTQNLPAPTISNGALYMAATLYTGNGTTTNLVNSVNGVSFKPDLVWQKNRSSAANHILVDSVRGGSLYLIPNSTSADASAPGYMTFNSNGESFTSSDIATNQNGQSYVSWQWQAGAGTTSSNTSGSITSTVSVNATAGFSIVTYTGTGANATVGHGLGVAPSMVIVKQRNVVQSWVVWQTAIAGTDYLLLNSTAAKATAASIWNSTTPTSTVFSIGTDVGTNQNGGTYVAYCFSAVRGYSAFGSYTGNGSATGDGPFVYLGFRPRWVMVKNISTAATDWILLDSARDTYNVTTKFLKPNLSDAEGSGSGMLFLSNGFKWQNDTGTSVNQSGATFIYAAFAENPFKLALAR